MTDKADKIKEYKKKSNKMQEQEVRTISRLKSMSIFLCNKKKMSVISEGLAFCPSVTLKKSPKGCNHHENYPNL